MRLVLSLSDGGEIISPEAQPNMYGESDEKIRKRLDKLGRGFVSRDKDIIGYRIDGSKDSQSGIEQEV